VRKLGAIIGSPESISDLAGPAGESEHFGVMEHHEFRFWQSLRRDELFDLVRSRSYVALLEESERSELLARVGALYDDYGRGPDGMQLPYLTRCYRTVVQQQALEAQAAQRAPASPPAPGRVDWQELAVDPDSTQPIGRVPHQAGPPEDPGTLLFDFR
jgi:hypothetical protein